MVVAQPHASHVELEVAAEEAADSMFGAGEGGAPWLSLGWDGAGEDDAFWSIDRKNVDKHASLSSAMLSLPS